ncbi:CLUMA_CG000354, isoform A [Clunio marinus]|uniref:CLUMA_CG000354, isoform A n=1 Tax=Clunio marinus TaxID=568069 RepID=A0A1J1HEJ7_9DIPT|nr:CLUMA_CG000354, isoform A [Clunio marinus]
MLNNHKNEENNKGNRPSKHDLKSFYHLSAYYFHSSAFEMSPFLSISVPKRRRKIDGIWYKNNNELFRFKCKVSTSNI